MSRAQTYEVEFADGRSLTVLCDGRDLLHYEEQTGESALELIVDGRMMRAWYPSAWAACHRQGIFDGTLEEFKEAAAFILPVTGNPTEAAPTLQEDSGS